MIKPQKTYLFSSLLFAVTMAALFVGRGSLIEVKLGVSNGNAGILAVHEKAKATAC